MPDYSGQLNQDRAQDVAKKNNSKGSFRKKLGASMAKAVEDGRSWVWIIVFALAILNDLLDLGIIGIIPVISELIDGFCFVVLTAFLWNIGGMIKWKIRVAIWTASLIEIYVSATILLVLIELAPFWVLAVLYAYFKVRKKAKIAEKGLELAKRGKIDREALNEFK